MASKHSDEVRKGRKAVKELFDEASPELLQTPPTFSRIEKAKRRSKKKLLRSSASNGVQPGGLMGRGG